MATIIYDNIMEASLSLQLFHHGEGEGDHNLLSVWLQHGIMGVVKFCGPLHCISCKISLSGEALEDSRRRSPPRKKQLQAHPLELLIPPHSV